MSREEWIARWIPALSGLGDLFESIKAQYPDSAPLLDPKIAELRAAMSAELLGNAVGSGLAELQTLLQTMKLDPRFHPSDLA